MSTENFPIMDDVNATIARLERENAVLKSALNASEELGARLLKKAGQCEAGMESRWFWSLYEVIEGPNIDARRTIGPKQ